MIKEINSHRVRLCCTEAAGTDTAVLREHSGSGPSIASRRTIAGDLESSGRRTIRLAVQSLSFWPVPYLMAPWTHLCKLKDIALAGRFLRNYRYTRTSAR